MEAAVGNNSAGAQRNLVAIVAPVVVAGGSPCATILGHTACSSQPYWQPPAAADDDHTGCLQPSAQQYPSTKSAHRTSVFK